MTVDYKAAFDHAPIGMAIGRNRLIEACNSAFAAVFAGNAEDFIGTSFEQLYPTRSDFTGTGDRFGPVLSEKIRFTDDRVMRRLDGELIWVKVRGHTFTPENPHEHTLWIFSNLRQSTPQPSALTPRERDIAALLIEAKTGKQIARELNISPRTVDIYKTRLLRKYNVSSTPELVKCLLTR